MRTVEFPGCSRISVDVTRGLNRLAVGQRGRVISVGGEVEVRRRLLEMGFCNGAVVEVIRRAPLGDPIQFRLRGYDLSLREEQARFVQVTPIVA